MYILREKKRGNQEKSTEYRKVKLLYTEKEQLIQKALLQGKRYDVIAKELGVSVKTITKVSKKISRPLSLRILKMFHEGKSPMNVLEVENADIKYVKQLWDDWAPMYKSWVETLEHRSREIKAKQDLEELGVIDSKDGEKEEHGEQADFALKLLNAVWDNVQYECEKCGFPLFDKNLPSCPHCGCKKCKKKNWEV